MKNALNKKEKELYLRIDRILWKDWDPIGVYNEDDEWDDEYAGYVPSVFKLVIEDRDVHKISNHLTSIIKDSMGMSTKTGCDHDRLIAAEIIQAKKEIIGE